MNNENTALVAYKDAADFNVHLFSNIETMFKHYEDLPEMVNIMRCRGMLTDDWVEMRWNYDQVYAPFDVVGFCFNKLTDGIFFEDLMDKGTLDSRRVWHHVRAMAHALPAKKLKNFVYLPKLKANKEALKMRTSKFLELPQWGVIFNLMDHDLIDPKKGKIAGLSFLREDALYIGKRKPIKSLSICVFHSDGKIEPSLKITIEQGKTVAQFLNGIKRRLTPDLIHWKSISKTSPNSYNQEFKDYQKFYEHIFTYLAYFLNNLDKIKDSSGNIVPFPANPAPKLLDPNDPHELHEDADTVTIYHLD